MALEVTADELRQVLDGVTALAEDYLRDLESRPIQPAVAGRDLSEELGGDPPEVGLGAGVVPLLRRVVEASRAQNGRFLGYVMGSGEPVGGAADLLASVVNQNVTAWRSSPAGVTLERAVVGWLAAAIGCRGFGGSLTGGGSAANLMALAMAREAKAPANERGAAPCVVYASEQVHMSIPKAVALLGIGRQNLTLISVDERFRMRVGHLEDEVRRDRAAGRTPIAVVASAGTVATGSVDPLDAIADVARREDLWLHVDGAYGALAAMVVPSAVGDLSRAHSLSLDAHKWLYQAVDCGCLLFREPAAAQRAFSHTGDYARSLSQDPVEGFAFFEESLELSRRFRALRLWTSLRYHGLAAFRDAIRADLAHARDLAERISREPALELLAPVELSAVCFRHRFAAEADARNAELLRAVNGRGRVYLSNATLRGAFALRACFVNHRTTTADVQEVVDEVLAAAAALGR